MNKIVGEKTKQGLGLFRLGVENKCGQILWHWNNEDWISKQSSSGRVSYGLHAADRISPLNRHLLFDSLFRALFLTTLILSHIYPSS